MATPRFRDLSPAAAVAVLDAFLGAESPVEFTEKLAGQHLTAQVSPGGRVRYSIKSQHGGLGRGGFFPELEDALESEHPPVSQPVTYQFEVLKKVKRPDFIDYPLKSKLTAVEYSGAMTSSVAEALNSAQRSVMFYTKDAIKKSVGGVIDDPAVKGKLLTLRDRLSSGATVRKEEMLDAESLLSDVVDSGRVPTTLGSKRMEGLFGSSPATGGFKIPSKAYADLQLRQARFYSIVRGHKEAAAVDRFEVAVSDPMSDKLVSDVLGYVDYMASGGPEPGFRMYFTVEEAQDLKDLADAYRRGDARSGTKLARDFFRRVGDKTSWVTSGLQETTQQLSRILTHKATQVTRSLYSENVLRSYVRQVLRT